MSLLQHSGRGLESHAIDVLGKISKAVALNVCLNAISGTRESLPCLLCLYFVLNACLGENSLSGSVQYIFADKLTRQVGGDSDVGLGLAVLLQTSLPGLRSMPQVQSLGQMVATQLASQWLFQMSPVGLGYVSGLLLVYLSNPVLAGSESGEAVYGFLIYKAAGSLPDGGEFGVYWFGVG